MSEYVDRIDKPLIRHITRYMGYGFKLDCQDGEDFVHDVYLECLKRIQDYNPKYTLGTLIELQVRNLISAQYKNPKGRAKMEAQHVEHDEQAISGFTPKIDEQILLEELKPYICKEMWYYLKDPYTPDYTAKTQRNPSLKLRDVEYMSFERIGELLGVTKQAISNRINKNRKQLREML